MTYCRLAMLARYELTVLQRVGSRARAVVVVDGSHEPAVAPGAKGDETRSERSENERRWRVARNEGRDEPRAAGEDGPGEACERKRAGGGRSPKSCARMSATTSQRVLTLRA